MKTVTKRENFTCILYDEELLKKSFTSIHFNMILCAILLLYISDFYERNYLYGYIVFCILFFVYFL